jgi:hypothetical protein
MESKPCECGNKHIQNKKYNQCSECVFRKSHGGKSRQEVYIERAKSKLKDITYKQVRGSLNIKPSLYTPPTYNVIGADEEGFMNYMRQDFAEKQAMEEELRELSKFSKSIKKEKKKSKPIKQISKDQLDINKLYKLTCIDMDHVTESICTGCGKYQGGDIRLSHSHIISRKECKEIGKPELIYNRDNITYHCMDFGENEGCHRLWENQKRRKELLDYENNKAYVKSVSIELYRKYLIYE